MYLTECYIFKGSEEEPNPDNHVSSVKVKPQPEAEMCKVSNGKIKPSNGTDTCKVNNVNTGLQREAENCK